MVAQIIGFGFFATLIAVLLLARSKSSVAVDPRRVRQLIEWSHLAEAAKIYWAYVEILGKGVAFRRISVLKNSKSEIIDAMVRLLKAGKTGSLKAAIDAGFLGAGNDVFYLEDQRPMVIRALKALDQFWTDDENEVLVSALNLNTSVHDSRGVDLFDQLHKIQDQYVPEKISLENLANSLI